MYDSTYDPDDEYPGPDYEDDFEFHVWDDGMPLFSCPSVIVASEVAEELRRQGKIVNIYQGYERVSILA